MNDRNQANMTNEDWENLRKQLRVLVDVYCELNDDVLKIKDLLKKIVKFLSEEKKKKKALKTKRS